MCPTVPKLAKLASLFTTLIGQWGAHVCRPWRPAPAYVSTRHRRRSRSSGNRGHAWVTVIARVASKCTAGNRRACCVVQPRLLVVPQRLSSVPMHCNAPVASEFEIPLQGGTGRAQACKQSVARQLLVRPRGFGNVGQFPGHGSDGRQVSPRA